MTLNQINLIVGVLVGLLLGSLFRKPRADEAQQMEWREPVKKAV